MDAILICSQCGQDISDKVVLDWNDEKSNVNREMDFKVDDYEEMGDHPLVTMGFAVLSFQPIYQTKPGLEKRHILDFSPQIWMNEADILPRVNDSGKCKCGAKVGFVGWNFHGGYELAWFIPNPNLTKWKQIDKGSPIP